MTVKSGKIKGTNKDPEERSNWSTTNWESVLSGLVGSYIRDTIEDIRVIRGTHKERNKSAGSSEKWSAKG
jgi:hypothetical protein